MTTNNVPEVSSGLVWEVESWYISRAFLLCKESVHSRFKNNRSTQLIREIYTVHHVEFNVNHNEICARTNARSIGSSRFAQKEESVGQNQKQGQRFFSSRPSFPPQDLWTLRTLDPGTFLEGVFGDGRFRPPLVRVRFSFPLAARLSSPSITIKKSAEKACVDSHRSSLLVYLVGLVPWVFS